MPGRVACARSSRRQKPWMVEIQAPSSSRASSWCPASTSRVRMRDRSSPAERSVNVITRIDSTSTPRLDRPRRSARRARESCRSPRRRRRRRFPRPRSPPAGRVRRRLTTCSCAPHPAHRAELAPRGARKAALRVVPDVTLADPSGREPAPGRRRRRSPTRRRPRRDSRRDAKPGTPSSRASARSSPRARSPRRAPGRGHRSARLRRRSRSTSM